MRLSGLGLVVQRLRQGWVPVSTTVRTSLRAGAPHTPAKSGSKAPAPLPEAVKEAEAEREARETEGLQRDLARAEAALAALRTEHEDLVAVRAQLARSVHRLEVRPPGALLLPGYQGGVHLSLQVGAARELLYLAHGCTPPRAAAQEAVLLTPLGFPHETRRRMYWLMPMHWWLLPYCFHGSSLLLDTVML